MLLHFRQQMPRIRAANFALDQPRGLIYSTSYLINR
jgi:hypothetical protein